MGDYVEITILKWNDLNPKSDKVRHPQWFRVNQNITLSQGLFGLNPAQKWVFICLLAELSKACSDTVRLNMDYFAHISGMDKKNILQAFEILIENGTMSKNCQSTDSPQTQQTDRQTDRQVHILDKIEPFDMEELYILYPRKLGKKRGLEKCRRVVKSQKDFERVRNAIQRYSRSVRTTKPEFIKHFSTFMGEWEDWENAEVGNGGEVISLSKLDFN